MVGGGEEGEKEGPERDKGMDTKDEGNPKYRVEGKANMGSKISRPM